MFLHLYYQQIYVESIYNKLFISYGYFCIEIMILWEVISWPRGKGRHKFHKYYLEQVEYIHFLPNIHSKNSWSCNK